MSGNSGKPWSSNLNAPQIPPTVYTAEKELFAGNLISAMLYGMPVNPFVYLRSPYLFGTSSQGLSSFCSSNARAGFSTP